MGKWKSFSKIEWESSFLFLFQNALEFQNSKFWNFRIHRNDRKRNFRPEAARTRVFLVVKKEGNFKFLKKVEFFDGGNVDEKRFEKI